MIIARHRLSLDIPATAFLWTIFAVIVAAVGVAMAGLDAVTGSVWEPAARIPRWFAAAVGASFTWSSLPVYLAHGYTRREFATQMPVFIAGLAATLALLMTVGFAVERILFRAAGLPAVLSRAHLFVSSDQFLLVLAEFLLLLPVWVVSGALVGAGFARNTGLGMLLVPTALVMVTVAEFVAGPATLPLRSSAWHRWSHACCRRSARRADHCRPHLRRAWASSGSERPACGR